MSTTETARDTGPPKVDDDGRHEARGRRDPRRRCRPRRRSSTSGSGGGSTPTSPSTTPSASSSSRRPARPPRSSSARRSRRPRPAAPGPLPDRLGHRGRARRARRPRRRDQRGLPPGSTRRAVRAGRRRPRRAGPPPTTRPTAPSPPSATPTATRGCCRRSRSGFPAASTPTETAFASTADLADAMRRAVGRPRRAREAHRAASTTRTGPTGTPPTWSRSRPGPSCRHERRHETRERSCHDHLTVRIDPAAVPSDRRPEDPVRRHGRPAGRDAAADQPVAGEPVRVHADVGHPRRARPAVRRRPAGVRRVRAPRRSALAPRDGRVPGPAHRRGRSGSAAHRRAGRRDRRPPCSRQQRIRSCSRA